MSTSFTFTKPAALVFIQLMILVAIHLGSRARRSETDFDTNVFRIVPWIAWLIAIACPLISAVYVVAAFTPSFHHQQLFITFAFLFFIAAIYSVYYVTLRIRLTEQSLDTSSIFGTRTTLFSDIASIEDQETNRTRILRVKNRRGKQVLYAVDWYVADYPILVDLIRERASHGETS
jgi:amino acid permease